MADNDAPPRRRIGRPRAAPYSSVSIHLRTVLHDQLIRLASARGESVSGLLRSHLERAFSRTPPREKS
jgi:hypothetical protein